MFIRYDQDGKQIRRKVVLDCSNDDPIVEQSHKNEVNINNIIKRHGMDLIAKTALLQTPEYTFDELPNNDFQEAMLIVTKAQETFEAMPSQLRKQFNNNPAEFMDFIHNPDNQDKMVDMGLAQRPDPVQPIQVEVTNPTITNPETPAE